jgi:hypothetical protein
MEKSKIIYFTKYTEKGPSSRYRSYQYIDYLKDDFDLVFLPFFNDEYIKNLYSNRKRDYIEILKCYIKRFFLVFKYLWSREIIFIEYELFPFFPPFFEYLLSRTNVKFILDYDDAIFHNYDQHDSKLVKMLFKNKISNISRNANLIITGSPYLTEYFKKFNDNVIEIPTSIILSKYNSQGRQKASSVVSSIGWIGSNSTSINILKIKDVLSRFIEHNPSIVFKFMGFDSNLKKHLENSNSLFYDWSELKEFDFLRSIDIGIMPLTDNAFNRGKCGFKLIQYMAMGKPTISSPLETNIKINRDNGNLFAVTDNQWYDSLSKMINEYDEYRNIGFSNIEIVRKYYSVEENSKKYIVLFKSII